MITGSRTPNKRLVSVVLLGALLLGGRAFGTSSAAWTVPDTNANTLQTGSWATVGESRLTTNSASPCNGGASCTTASVTTTNNATLLILVLRAASTTSSDSVTSVTGPLTSAATIASLEYPTASGKDYLFAWKAVGNGTSGTVTVNFAAGSNANPTVVDVIQLSGNNTTTPIAQAPTALATSGNATANLTSPTTLNGELVLASFLKNAAITTPTGFTPVDTMSTGSAGGMDFGLYFNTAAQATTTITSPDSTKGWGTVALEINHA